MSKHKVTLLLELFKRAREDGSVTDTSHRPDNRSTLTALGLLPSDMLDIVCEMRPEQALHAPWENRYDKFRHELTCDFGIEVDGHDVYVKITAVGTETEAHGCVISFHFAEKPFHFPFD
jgi:hypothetical protein